MNKHILAASIGLFALAGGNAWADHLVAIAGPMTGQYASAGDQIRKGAELAIAEINAKGGVLGQKLKLEVGDDACDPKQAVSVANTMVNKKIVFMHGHWCSSSTIPASDVYNEAQIPMATVSTNPQVTERGLKNIFRIMGRDDQQGLVAGSYTVTPSSASYTFSPVNRAVTITSRICKHSWVTRGFRVLITIDIRNPSCSP